MDDSQPHLFLGNNDSILSVNEGLPPALLIHQNTSGGKVGGQYMDQSLKRQLNYDDVAVKSTP